MLCVVQEPQVAMMGEKMNLPVDGHSFMPETDAYGIDKPTDVEDSQEREPLNVKEAAAALPHWRKQVLHLIDHRVAQTGTDQSQSFVVRLTRFLADYAKSSHHWSRSRNLLRHRKQFCPAVRGLLKLTNLKCLCDLCRCSRSWVCSLVLRR